MNGENTLGVKFWMKDYMPYSYWHTIANHLMKWENEHTCLPAESFYFYVLDGDNTGEAIITKN